jgi:hypothetical protein
VGRAGKATGLAVLLAGAILAGCSSNPASQSTTTTRAGRPPPLATTTTTTSTTTTVPTTSAPPVQSSTVHVQISGSTAGVEFTSSAVSGSLSPAPGAFSQGGTVYTFTVSGVVFSGPPSTTTAAGGLITSVVVSGGSGGPTIKITLSSPASHTAYGLGHDQVSVTFS